MISGITGLISVLKWGLYRAYLPEEAYDGFLSQDNYLRLRMDLRYMTKTFCFLFCLPDSPISLKIPGNSFSSEFRIYLHARPATILFS